jgi:hypothetical protein
MNMKRMRGRNHRPNGGGGGNNGGGGFRNQQNGIPLNRNHVFDSSGPEMRSISSWRATLPATATG